MTEAEFRKKHSVLIEYYQLIEMRLRMLCATVTAEADKSWFRKIDDYQGDSLGQLIRRLQVIQTKQQTEQLSANEIQELDSLRISRNYWCHECFGLDDPVTFSRSKGADAERVVKRAVHVKRLIDDLQKANDWDERLTEACIAAERKKQVNW